MTTLGKLVIVNVATPDAKTLHAQEVQRFAQWRRSQELGAPWSGEAPKAPPPPSPERCKRVGIITGFDKDQRPTVRIIDGGEAFDPADLEELPLDTAALFHPDSPVKTPAEVRALLELTPSVNDPKP